MEEEFPQWTKERAAELFNIEADAVGRTVSVSASDFGSDDPYDRAFLRLIAKYEPEPVDPDKVLARELAAISYEHFAWPKSAIRARAGKSDGTGLVQSILAKIKEHRAGASQ